MTSTVACCGVRAALDRQRRLDGADREARSLETYWRHSSDRRRTSSVHGACQRSDVEEDRRDERDPLAGLELVEQRREVALGRGRRQPLGAVAPVGHARVLDVAGERRVAQPVGQVVVEHGRSARAGSRSRGRRARRLGAIVRATSRTLLLSSGAVSPAPSSGRRRSGRRCRAGRRARARRRRPAAAARPRPPGSGWPTPARAATTATRARTVSSAIASSQRGRRAAPGAAQQRRPARRRRRAAAPPGRTARASCRASRAGRRRRRLRPRRARVGRLVERGRDPRQVQRERAAEGDRAEDQQLAPLLPSATPGRARRGRRRRRRTAPSCACRASPPAPPRRRSPTRGSAARERAPEGRRGHQRQQGEQRVHAPLLRVLGEERVGRREHGRHPRRARAEQPARRPPRDGHGEQRAGDRQPADRLLRAARDAASRRAAACSRAAASRRAAAPPGCRRAGGRRSRPTAPRRSRSRCPARACAGPARAATSAARPAGTASRVRDGSARAERRGRARRDGRHGFQVTSARRCSRRSSAGSSCNSG